MLFLLQENFPLMTATWKGLGKNLKITVVQK